jgi:hypothetical protein
MFWLYILIPIGTVYLGLALMLVLFQSQFVYFPERTMIGTPQHVGLSYDAVSFEVADGMRLSGWFIPAEKSRGVILFCHGNGGNIYHRLDYLEIFHRLGLSTFIFDYRGYGQSEGKPTEKGTYQDGEAAWRYLVEKRQIAPTDIILFGESLGGAVVSWLAQHYTPRALILQSTFTSVPDIGAKVYPYLPVRLLSRFNYNTLEYIQRVHSPVLIIHSPEDEIIPFYHGRRLFEAAREPKEFLEITGDHNEGFLISGNRYEDGLNRFISKYSSTNLPLKKD